MPVVPSMPLAILHRFPVAPRARRSVPNPQSGISQESRTPAGEGSLGSFEGMLKR